MRSSALPHLSCGHRAGHIWRGHRWALSHSRPGRRRGGGGGGERLSPFNSSPAGVDCNCSWYLLATTAPCLNILREGRALANGVVWVAPLVAESSARLYNGGPTAMVVI